MEEINKAYATFRERDRIASLGGGVEKFTTFPGMGEVMRSFCSSSPFLRIRRYFAWLSTISTLKLL